DARAMFDITGNLWVENGSKEEDLELLVKTCSLSINGALEEHRFDESVALCGELIWLIQHFSETTSIRVLLSAELSDLVRACVDVGAHVEAKRIFDFLIGLHEESGEYRRFAVDIGLAGLALVADHIESPDSEDSDNASLEEICRWTGMAVMDREFEKGT